MKFAVGEPTPVPMIGEGYVPFYPIVDAETGEHVTCFPSFRYREDAESEVARYNAYGKETP